MLAAELGGWDALRYTQRGAPPSTLAGPFTVGRHAADALTVLDQHNLGSAVVLGHSWGGYLAMQLAAAAPDRVRGLVLIDTLGATGDGGFGAFARQLAARIGPQVLARIADLDELAAARPGTAEGETAAAESLRLTWPGYYGDPAAAPPPPPGFRFWPECYQQTIASITAAQGDAALPAGLARYRGPAEIVAGGASPFPAEVAESTAALFRQARLSVAGGAGHFPWAERPGCVAAALSRISARLLAADLRRS